MALLLVDGDASARVQVLDPVAREPSVPREARDVEVDVATFLVGMTRLDQSVDHLEHLDDVIGGARVHRRLQATEPPQILEEDACVLLADLPGIDALATRARLELVLAFVLVVVGEVPDVGDVHHLGHLQPDVLHPAPQGVREEIGPEVPDVGAVVDRGPAVVHPHAAGLEGLEGLLLPGQRVVDEEAQRTPFDPARIGRAAAARSQRPRRRDCTRRDSLSQRLPSCAMLPVRVPAPPPTPPPPLNRSEPRFRLEEEIGEGASSRVWRARLEQAWGGRPAGTTVAVKRLRPEWHDDADARAAFEREALIGLSVRAPGLLAVLGHGEGDEGPWIASDLVGGRDLGEVLADTGALPEPLVRRIALRLAGALEALHGAGFLHGDLKPENVRLDGEGNAVLVDLGFAQPLKAQDADASRRPGTIAYLSPEQARGARADERSEVFSLGVLLYEIATGTHPFLAPGTTADESPALLAAAAFQRPSLRAPTLTPFFDLLLEEWLQAEPSARPDLAELARRLGQEERGEWWRTQLDLSAVARRGGRGEGAGGRFTPFVGRDKPLARLHESWRAVRERGDGDSGGIVWLRGEAGSTSTRAVPTAQESAPAGRFCCSCAAPCASLPARPRASASAPPLSACSRPRKSMP